MLQDFTEDMNGKAIAYEGNGNLKPAKCCLPYTKEHIEEIIKCKKDWNYFAEHYYHIVSLDEGIIKVKPRDYQKNIINNFIDNRFNIILASRQCVSGNTAIRLRNKETTIPIDISIEKLFSTLKTGIKSEYFELEKLNSVYEIDTDEGWKDFSGIGRTQPSKTIKLILENSIILTCSYDHLLFTKKFKEIEAIKLNVNDYVYTKYGYQKIVSKNFSDEEEPLYDILDVENERYFTNGILSHNCGKSTSYEIFCMWYILFNESKTIAVLANKLETAVGILSKIKLAYELLPKFLQQGIKKWNEKSIELENGCKIIASATSSSAIRSKSINCLVLDELAFVPNKQFQKFFDSVYPTISSSQGSKIIMVSTPNGYNHFYKFWSDAIKGIEGSAGKGNKFIPLRVDWWQVPGRDEKWKEETIANIGKQAFMTEYANDFLGSSLTLIEGHILSNIVIKEPTQSKLKIEEKYKKFINIFELPQENHTYVLGLDSAEMMEDTTGDSISIQLLDVTTLPFKQVAACNIREGITYFEVPEIAVRLAKYFNDAYMFIEANSTGLEVANMIESDFEYENVYHEKTLPGVKTTKKTKRLGCSNLKMLIEGGHLILNDAETISQLSTFIKKRNSYAADSGFLDDAVMSLMISLFFMNDKEAIDSLANLDFTKNSMKENIEDQGNVGLICGIIDVDGVINYELENSTEFMDEWGWLYGK